MSVFDFSIKNQTTHTLSDKHPPKKIMGVFFLYQQKNLNKKEKESFILSFLLVD